MTVQTIVTGILLIGLIFAVFLEVFIFLIKNYKMESELLKVKGLLELDAAKEVLVKAGETVESAQKRIDTHYKNWKRLNENKEKPGKWNFEGVPTSDEAVKELAKEVLGLIATEKCSKRRKEILKSINEYSTKKQEEILTQIEALLELYSKDKMKFDVEEESLNVEEAELQERLQEIAKRREEKTKKD